MALRGYQVHPCVRSGRGRLHSHCCPMVMVNSSTLGVYTRMSMVLSKWIITPIKVGCKSHK